MYIGKLEIPGIAELDAQLARLSKAVATDIGEEATRRSAELLRDKIEAAAPISIGTQSPSSQRYGHLRLNVKVVPAKSIKVNWIGYRVTSGDAFWAVFLEYGTVSAPAHPFWRPTIDSVSGQVRALQTDIYNRGIASALAGKSA